MAYIPWDTLNAATKKYFTKQLIEGFWGEVRLAQACKHGYYCVKCRQKFIYCYGALLCGCPTVGIKFPIQYKERIHGRKETFGHSTA
jgi:hypothetical protein